MLCSIIGNGVVCLLLLRFKTLRTVPNILIVNIAVIDVINALINMPLLISWYVCRDGFLKGRWTSWIVISTYVMFMNLTVFALVVLMMDRYGAICHGLRYHSWKTKEKAFIAVALTWFIAGLYTYVQFGLGLNINVGDKPVNVYRKYYFVKFGRFFVTPGYLIPFAVILLLAFLMWRSVRANKARIAAHCSFYGKRTHSDVVTAKTIGLTILAYFFMGCFPIMLHNVARIHGSWAHFLAYFFVHMNSMINPIIYSLRTRRFRRAFCLLMKDPCGRTQPVNLRRRQILGSSTTMVSSTTVRQRCDAFWASLTTMRKHFDIFWTCLATTRKTIDACWTHLITIRKCINGCRTTLVEQVWQLLQSSASALVEHILQL